MLVKQAQDNNTRGMTKQSLSYTRTQMENKERIYNGLLRKKAQIEKRNIELTRRKEQIQESISKIISSDSKLRMKKLNLIAIKLKQVDL